MIRYYNYVSASLLFEPRDLWIGLYIKPAYVEMAWRIYEVYLCLVPMFPLRVSIAIVLDEYRG